MTLTSPCRTCGRPSPCPCGPEDRPEAPPGARILPFRRKPTYPAPNRAPDDTPPSAA